MSLLNSIGDGYHKHYFRHQLTFMRNVTSKIQRPLSDPLFTFIKYVPEMLALAATGVVSLAYLAQEANSVEINYLEILQDAAINVAFATGIASSIYLIFAGGLNNFRTPIESKLDLDTNISVDLREDYRYTLQNLEKLANAPKLTLEDATVRCQNAVKKYIKKIESYDMPNAPPIKVSKNSNYFTALGVEAVCNSLFNEIVLFNDRNVDVIPHEIAHQFGYLKEREANFVAYASCIESDDPSLNYYAYLQRALIARSIDRLLPKEEFPPQILAEFDSLSERRETAARELTRYTRAKMRVFDAIHNVKLLISGQGNSKDAYGLDSLRLITAYDPPTS